MTSHSFFITVVIVGLSMQFMSGGWNFSALFEKFLEIVIVLTVCICTEVPDQTLQTLIRLLVRSSLIRVCSVCQHFCKMSPKRQNGHVLIWKWNKLLQKWLMCHNVYGRCGTCLIRTPLGCLKKGSGEGCPRLTMF